MNPWHRWALLALVTACQAGLSQRASPTLPRVRTLAPPRPASAESTPNTQPPGSETRSETSELIGSDGPVVFEAAGRDGSWTLFCQARSDTDSNGRIEVRVGPLGDLSGDVLTRWLVLASGAPSAIDDLLVRSEDDRRVLFRSGKRLLLLEKGRISDLTLTDADLRFEPGSWSGHRAVALSDSTLFYARVSRGRSELVTRNLNTGEERVEYGGRAPIVRFEVHNSGALVVLRVGGADSNGNGRFDWPFVARANRPCVGPIPRFTAPRMRADSLGTLVLDRRVGTLRRVDDLVLPFGEALVRRTGDGTLWLDQAGKIRMLSDLACAGRILWTDPEREQLLLGCAAPKKPGRLLVELVHGLTRVPLEIDVAALGFDEPLGDSRRLLALYPGADSVLFDLELRKLHRLRAGDIVLHVSGPNAVVRRGRQLYVFKSESSTESALPGDLDRFGALLVQRDLVYASPFVVDARTGHSIGHVPGVGLALTLAGRVLLPATAASATSLALGPLRWQMPVPGLLP